MEAHGSFLPKHIDKKSRTLIRSLIETQKFPFVTFFVYHLGAVLMGYLKISFGSHFVFRVPFFA